MDTVTAEVEKPARRRRRFRVLKVLFVLCLLLVLLVASLPYVLTAGPIVRHGLATLEPHLRSKVEIASAQAGWLSGIALAGVRVEQPPEYPAGDLFSLQSLRIACPLMGAIRGRPDVEVEIVAPKLKMIRRLGDRWNVLELQPPAPATPPRREATREPGQPPEIPTVRFDLSLRNGEIEVWEEEAPGKFRPLEAIRNLSARMKSTGFEPPYDLQVEGELQRASDKGGPGRIALSARVDPRLPMPLLLAEITAKAFSLDHYAPLLQAFGGPLTRTDGQLDGTLTVTPVDAESLRIGGEMVMSRVHLAGPALGTREIVADRWSLVPGAKVALDGQDVDLSGLVLDLGFARVRGLDGTGRAGLGLTGTKGVLAVALELDLGALLAMPGMRPPGIDSLAGTVRAQVGASWAGVPTVKVIANTGELTARGTALPPSLQRIEPLQLQADCTLDESRAGTARLATAGATVDVEFRAPAGRPIETRTVAALDLDRIAALRAFLPESISGLAGSVLLHVGTSTDLPAGRSEFTADATGTKVAASGTAIPADLVFPEEWKLAARGSFETQTRTLDLPRTTLEFAGTRATLACKATRLETLDATLAAKVDGGVGAQLMARFLPAGVVLTGATEADLKAACPLPTAGAEPSTLLQRLVVTGTLKAPNAEYLGNQLQQVSVSVAARDGRAEFVVPETTRLNGGKLTLRGDYVLAGDSTQPARLALEWDGGKAMGSLTPLLGYAVPLLAGLDARTLTEYAALDFNSGIRLKLDLAGPAAKKAGEGWLAVLNRWSGSGNLQLQDGAFTTGAAITQLLAALGQDKKLQFQQVATAFRIQDGFLINDNLQLSGKAGKLGLAGRTGLDGSLDYQLDVTELLRGHKDGDRIVKALGQGRARASLKGTLWSPSVDLADTLTAVLQNAGNQLIQDLEKDPQKAIDAIRDLFRKKKKDEPKR